MSKFKVEIEEILQRVEEVEADSLEEALEIIDEKYTNQEIVLDSEDFQGHEIREYVDGVREKDLEQDSILELKYGKAIMIEGDKNLALIKKIGVKDYPYVIVSGLTPCKYKTYFEWNQGTYCQTLDEAVDIYNELTEKETECNDLIYSELGKATLENYCVSKFNNVDEIFNFLIEDEMNKEDLISMFTEKMKKQIISNYADSIVEENGKYYYGQDLWNFEEDINEKVRKIDNILNRFNIKNVKPYDVIELIEQEEYTFEPRDEQVIKKVYDEIRESGYEGSINSFIKNIKNAIDNEENIEESEI